MAVRAHDSESRRVPATAPAVRLWAGIAGAAALSTGCASGTAGHAAPAGQFGPPIAEVRTSEADSLRVLWNGGRSGPIDKDAAWLATGPEELIALWRAAGVQAPVPRVDFLRTVVVAFVTADGPCSAEIVRAVSDGRTIRLIGIPTRFACADVRVGIAQVVALPRRIVPSRVIVVGFGEWGLRSQGYEFDVSPHCPTSSAPEAGSRGAATAMASPALELRMPRSGVIESPAAGHIALRALADGTQVWVAHRTDGSISVLSATLIGEETGLGGPVAWWSEDHRLAGGYDSHGRSVQGFASLPSYAFRRLAGSLLEVSPRRAPDDDGPIEAREAAPVLDGSDRPYSDLAPTASWNEVPEGGVALLDASVVFGQAGPPRLCAVPASPIGRFPGCPYGSPALAGSFRIAPRVVFSGPVVVRRRGDKADLIAVRGGYERYAGP